MRDVIVISVSRWQFQGQTLEGREREKVCPYRPQAGKLFVLVSPSLRAQFSRGSRNTHTFAFSSGMKMRKRQREKKNKREEEQTDFRPFKIILIKTIYI